MFFPFFYFFFFLTCWTNFKTFDRSCANVICRLKNGETKVKTNGAEKGSIFFFYLYKKQSFNLLTFPIDKLALVVAPFLKIKKKPPSRQ